MERAKKMVIVPEETLQRMQSMNTTVQPPPPPTTTSKQEKNFADSCDNDNSMQTCGDSLSRLDAEMHAILHSKKFTDEREKSKNYLQVLRRYLFFKDAERHEERVDTESDSPTLTTDTILENVAIVNQRKARLLLSHWQASGRFKWATDGAVIIDGQKIQNSNIIELLNNIVSKKRKNEDDSDWTPPIGQFEIARFIKAVDTPTSLINNSEILKIVKKLVAKRRLPQSQATPSLTRAAAAKKKWLKLDM